MARSDHPADPRGLIRESYRMDDLSPEACRAIFLDWALGATSEDLTASTASLLMHYAPLYPDHPMTALLKEGTEPNRTPRKRSGRPRR